MPLRGLAKGLHCFFEAYRYAAWPFRASCRVKSNVNSLIFFCLPNKMSHNKLVKTLTDSATLTGWLPESAGLQSKSSRNRWLLIRVQISWTTRKNVILKKKIFHLENASRLTMNAIKWSVVCAIIGNALKVLKKGRRGMIDLAVEKYRAAHEKEVSRNSNKARQLDYNKWQR